MCQEKVMLPLKAVLSCLKVGEASYLPEGFSQDSLAPKSYLPALLQHCCTVFQILPKAAVTDHKLNN